MVVIAGDGGFPDEHPGAGDDCAGGLAVKIIVLNNSFLGMVRQWQELFEKRYSFTHMQNPDFVAKFPKGTVSRQKL